MRMICSDIFESKLVLNHNVIYSIVLENPKDKAYVLENLFSDENKGLILSMDEKPVSLLDNSIQILNVCRLDFNSKEIHNAILKRLQVLSKDEVYASKNNQLIRLLNEYADSLEMDLPFDIEFEDGVDVFSILKTLSFEIDSSYSSFCEKIIAYMKLTSSLLKKDIFIFVDLKTYLCKEEILEIYKNAIYNEYKLICIESFYFEDTFSYEKCVVLDHDSCEIIAV